MIINLHAANSLSLYIYIYIYTLILIRSCTEYCKIYFYYIFFGFIIYFFITRNCVLRSFFVDRCCYAIMYAVCHAVEPCHLYQVHFYNQFQSCFVFQYSYTDRKKNIRIFVKLYLSIDAVNKRFRSHHFITNILKYITFIYIDLMYFAY